MKKLLLAVSAGFSLSMFMAAAAWAGPVLQMRLVTDVAAGDCDCDDMAVVQKNGDTSQKESLHVLHKVWIDQTDLKSAQVETNSFGHPQIAITLNTNGMKHFAEVTRNNIGKRMAIIVDGQLYSAPAIRSEISSGKAMISGNFTSEEAKELATKLNEAVKNK